MPAQKSQKTFLIEGIIGLDILPYQISDFLKSAHDSPVKFQINSPGGFVFDAIAIHNLILQYPAEVEIEILSLCASSASFISTAGDIVSVFPDSVYMLHNAWLFSFGDHNKLREDANHIEKVSNLLVNAYSNFSKKSIDEIKALMDAETFLFGREIVDNNFAHMLIEEKDFLNDDINSAVDYSKKSIQASFDRMSTVKSFSQDILSASALIDSMHSILWTTPLSPLPASIFSAVSLKDPAQPQIHITSSANEPSAPDTANAPAKSAISPEVADFNFSDNALPNNSVEDKVLVDKTFPNDSGQNENIALFNLFEKLSLIENKIDSLSHSINHSINQSSSDSSLNVASLEAPLIDSDFFEYRLNALVNARMILPAHKELILKIVNSINQSFLPSDSIQSFDQLNSQSSTQNLSDPPNDASLFHQGSASPRLIFSLFEKLISLPPAHINSSADKNQSSFNLEDEFNFKNSDNSSFMESFNLPVDPQSRKIHFEILEIMEKHNCSYISAYSIYNQLNK